MPDAKSVTVNGLVQIHRTVNDRGDQCVEILDYEHVRIENHMFIFKSYDKEGRTVYIHIDTDTIVEAMVGDPDHPLPDPNDDEPGGTREQ